MDEKFMNRVKQLQDLTHQATDKQAQFFQHILLVAVSIFGILISLHTNTSPCLYIRLVFALSMVLLSLGILCIVITVYDHTMLAERIRKAYHEELEKSLAEKRDPETVATKKLPRTLFCQKYGLIFLLISLFLLVIYLLLTLFV